MNSFIIFFGIYITLSCVSRPLQSLQFQSISFVFLICYSYKLINTLQVPTSYKQLYLTFLSLFSFNIILKGFLFPYSSAFLLSVSVPLTYLILKQCLANISTYLTYFQFSSFIIRNPVKFLQSILITNSSIIPCKNTLYSFNAVIIVNNSLL